MTKEVCPNKNILKKCTDRREIDQFHNLREESFFRSTKFILSLQASTFSQTIGVI